MTRYVPRHRVSDDAVPGDFAEGDENDASPGAPEHFVRGRTRRGPTLRGPTLRGPTRRGPTRRGRSLARLAVGLAVITAGVGATVALADGSGGRAAVTTGAPPTEAPAATAGGIPVVERPARPEGAPAVGELPPSPPLRIEIPAIGVSSDLEPLGLNDDGTMQVPNDFQRAGWFTLGPQPGQPGPAVIAGHVDSHIGPAVFFRLGELTIGEEVLIPREDGSTARFRVTAVESYPKDSFPAAAVYGPVPGPELRLITCDGAFDRSIRQYQDNLIVYAVAV